MKITPASQIEPKPSTPPKINPKDGAGRLAVFHFLIDQGPKGATFPEIAEGVKKTVPQPLARLAELKTMGLIVVIGKRSKTGSPDAIVWAAKRMAGGEK